MGNAAQGLTGVTISSDELSSILTRLIEADSKLAEQIGELKAESAETRQAHRGLSSTMQRIEDKLDKPALPSPGWPAILTAGATVAAVMGTLVVVFITMTANPLALAIAASNKAWKASIIETRQELVTEQERLQKQFEYNLGRIDILRDHAVMDTDMLWNLRESEVEALEGVENELHQMGRKP